MDLNMEDQLRTTTKSILDVVSGNVLDIPNGKDKILDHYKNATDCGKSNVKLFKKNPKHLVNNPNQ